MQRLPYLLAACAIALTGCADPTDIASADAVLSAPSAAAPSNSAYGPDGTARYRISVTNLTAGQPFTPPLIATHRKPEGMFTVGEGASFGLQEIAENGNLGPMNTRLQNSKRVADVTIAVAGDPPPLMPAQTVTVELGGSEGARYLSFVSMLICTNDGFTGVDGRRLPKAVGDQVQMSVGAYDAGTEINTEDFADLVPPCPALTGVVSNDPGTGTSDPTLAEGGVVHPHGGVVGGSDLDPSIHDWTDPVAHVLIERVQ